MKRLTARFAIVILLISVLIPIFTACGHEHSYGEWRTTKNATCTEYGEEARFCECGEKQTNVIGKLGHNYMNGICDRCWTALNNNDHPNDNEKPNEEIGPNDNNYCLKFTSNGDGTCYVSDIEDCLNAHVAIPSISPDGWIVTSIGSEAFSWCYSLTSVVIPDSVVSIGDSAFSECVNLKIILIPESVTNVDDSAFSGCTSLTNIAIPDSVTRIGNYAFSWCDSLTSVVISDSVTSIGDSSFSGCTSLTNIAIPDSVTRIGNYAFSGCDSLTSVVIPDGVTNIGDGAFYDCSSLESVVIPDSIECVGHNAFESCDNLQFNEYDNALYLGNEDNTHLALIKAKDKQIASCYVHDDTKIISDWAFSDCRYSLMSVVISDSVEKIGDMAIADCQMLTSIKVSQGNSNYESVDGNLYTKDGKTLIQYAVGKSATSFEIPDGVEIIGSDAFSWCDSLESVVIPDSVENIGDKAFYGCESLISVVIPDNVANIGDRVFCYCSSLTSIEVSQGNSDYESIDGNLYTKGGKTLIQYAIGKLENSFTLPDNVTNIGDWALSYCELLTSVAICENITSIGEWSFYACSALSSVVIGDGVESIGDRAFDGCNNLKFNEYENALYLGNEENPYLVLIKAKDEQITSCNIHDDTKIIVWDAFGRCDYLKNVVIGDSVTSIGNWAFSCDSLTDVYYTGSEEEWAEISIGDINDGLTYANIHYNYVPQ